MELLPGLGWLVSGKGAVVDSLKVGETSLAVGD